MSIKDTDCISAEKNLEGWASIMVILVIVVEYIFVMGIILGFWVWKIEKVSQLWFCFRESP